MSEKPVDTTIDDAEVEALDENKLIAERRQKLRQLRAERAVAYPNQVLPTHSCAQIHAQFAQETDAQTLEDAGRFTLAGRMLAKRVMGKASFAQIQDGSGERMQLYIARDALQEGRYAQFKTWDRGDIIEATGSLFRTKTGELSLKVEALDLVTKSLRPLPEKFHGLTDQEARYRRRYVDLMINAQSREVFVIRSKVISYIRQFFERRDFLEVETPMMHPIPGGATARPFITHHNALDMPLFLRIAPELYLKRLVVGGLERVFEINRNFRNEGISTRHNPEFTMLEFYQAYANYQMLMDLSEELLGGLTQTVLGNTQIEYQGQVLDFGRPFARLTLLESIAQYAPQYADCMQDKMRLIEVLKSQFGLKINGEPEIGMLQTMLFEEAVEHLLIQPTFITDYPAVVSPLSRRRDDYPEIAERFELFIGGREIANGFSELNDPEDQAERFQAQAAAKNAGDDEAMHYDSDYICALEYGMPPTAGEGIGIDRLVMLLTNSASIRDVLLFPLLRNES